MESPTRQAAAGKADPSATATVQAIAAGKSTAANSEGSDDLVTWDVGEPVKRERSIYDSWTTRRRYVLLLLMSFATFLVPFSDTVYLPALNVIQQDLHTTSTLMAATVAVYMFCVGLSALVWGPFADRYGRRLTLLISSALFTGCSIACTFSPNIGMLVAFRALQGCAVSAMMVSSNAVLADSWEPAQRGKAMGIFMIPTLVGPIVGPLLGGGLSQALGWRSTFVAMAVIGGAIFLCILLFMEETHHHVVLKRIRTSEGDLAAKSVKEFDQIKAPVFRAPWQPLRYLVEPAILPHALVMFLLYATMFSGLIILPVALAHPPYNLTEALIGVANLPLGLGCFIVGPFGGRWADWGARKWDSSPAGRMVPGLVASFTMFPASTLAYAWTLHYGTNLAGPLICSFFMGASICAFFPGVMSYVSILKQQAAAAAGGAVQAMMFICGGVFIQITPPAMAALGIGGWVTVMVGIVFTCAFISAIVTMREIRRAAAAREQLPTTQQPPRPSQELQHAAPVGLGASVAPAAAAADAAPASSASGEDLQVAVEGGAGAPEIVSAGKAGAAQA